MMTLLILKTVAALSILAVGILGGIVPLLAARRQASQRFFSLGNALAGGIFLGVGFTHLLPEAEAMLAASPIIHWDRYSRPVESSFCSGSTGSISN